MSKSSTVSSQKVAMSMNVTLSLLAVASLNFSPFFSGSQTKLSTRLLFDRVTLHGSFSHFSYNAFNAHYLRSEFRRFLSSAIRVEQENLREIVTHQPFAFGFDSQVTVTDCFFQSDSMGSGGAINMLFDGSTLSVDRSGFSRCTSLEAGGAISFFGKVLAVSHSCFHRCSSRDSGMAIESVNRESESSIRIVHTSISKCTDIAQMDDFQQHSLHLLYGKQFGRNLNSTKCYAYFGGAFVGSEDSTHFDFQMINVYFPSGDNILNLGDIKPKASKLAYLNIVGVGTKGADNRIPTSIFRLEKSEITLERSSVFVNSVMYVSELGSLRMWWCTTNLKKGIESLNGAFTHIFTSFQESATKTVAINVNTNMCYAAGKHFEGKIEEVRNEEEKEKENVKDKIPEIRDGVSSAMGTFLVFCLVSSVFVSGYVCLSSRKRRNSSNLEDVEFANL